MAVLEVSLVGAFLLRDGEVLLGLRAPHKSFPNCWDMFGGHVEGDETDSETLIRELREEIGIVPTQFRKVEQLKLDFGQNQLNLAVYLVSQWCGGEPIMLSDEHLEIRWFGIEEAANLTNLPSIEIRRLLQTLK